MTVKADAASVHAKQDQAKRVEQREAFIARLQELREAAIREGMPLLSWKEIEDQLARHRGEA